MLFPQILTSLMEDRKVSAYRIAKDLGLSDRLIGYWKKGEKTPSASNLQALADYFGVSSDYLLGNTDDPTPANKKKASPEEIEAELLAMFVRLGVVEPGVTISKEKMDELIAHMKIFADGLLK